MNFGFIFEFKLCCLAYSLSKYLLSVYCAPEREIDNMRLCLQATHKLWERQIIDKGSDVLEEM